MRTRFEIEQDLESTNANIMDLNRILKRILEQRDRLTKELCQKKAEMSSFIPCDMEEKSNDL